MEQREPVSPFFMAAGSTMMAAICARMAAPAQACRYSQGPLMEHRPLSYKTLSGAFQGMKGTLIGQVIREAVDRNLATLPFEVVCICDNTVKLIVSLGHEEGAAKPFIVRAWDWIGYGLGGRPRKVRGKLRLLTINACGEVANTSIYPPERIIEL
jgi:hypothetical protein